MVKASTWLNTLRKNPELAHTNDWHITTLNANGKSTTMAENDGVVALEKAIAVLRDRTNQSDSLVQASLRTVIHLVGDLHCISHIRIEGVQHSWHDFNVCRYAAASGSKAKIISRSKWSSFWSVYSAMHNGFHAELWAEDLDVCFGAKRAEISHGTLHDWVHRNGMVASKLYGVITPERTLSRVEFLRLESCNCEMMAAAGLRLATLLNSTIK
jgi:hypothetical protein